MLEVDCEALFFSWELGEPGEPGISGVFTSFMGEQSILVGHTPHPIDTVKGGAGVSPAIKAKP